MRMEHIWVQPKDAAIGEERVDPKALRCDRPTHNRLHATAPNSDEWMISAGGIRRHHQVVIV